MTRGPQEFYQTIFLVFVETNRGTRNQSVVTSVQNVFTDTVDGGRTKDFSTDLFPCVSTNDMSIRPSFGSTRNWL